MALGGLILLVVVFVVARSLVVRRSSHAMDVEVPLDTMEAAEGDAATKSNGLNTSNGGGGNGAPGGDIPYADDDEGGEPVKNGGGGNGYAPVKSDD